MISTSIAAALLVALASPVPPDGAPAPNDWTILVYGGSDNSSEESFGPDVEALRRGIPATGRVELFCLVDRSPGFSDSTAGFGEDFADTRLYRLTRDAAERLDGRPELPEITAGSSYEANSGDATLLRDYLRWARTHHPARHTALIVYTHGNGWTFCPDETDGGDELYPAELSDVLAAEDSLDLVVFDVCEMSSLEDAWQWRPGTGRFGIDVMVATPMAGFPFPWESILGRFEDPATLTPEEFGRIVVEQTEAHRRRELARGDLEDGVREIVRREAMACLRLDRIGPVKEALDALAVRLAAHEDGPDWLFELRGRPGAAGALSYAERPLYVDVFDLGRRAAEADGLPEDVRAAGVRLAEATEAAVVASYGLSAYDRFGGFQPGRHGVQLILPPPGLALRDAWAAVRFLTPDATAGEGPGYGRYAFCRDGATPGDGRVTSWWELLDLTFDPDDQDGGANGFSP
ncbi:MAG: clostripain-related cysteine peptidase [Planctomycetota bacterium JB042]